MATLVEIREELNAKRKELHEVWQQAGPERDFDKVTMLGQGDTDAKLAEMRRRSQVIDDLADQEQKLAHVEQIAQQNEREMKRLNDPESSMVHGGIGGSDRPFKAGDLRKALNEHRQYKAFREGSIRSFTIDLPNVDFKTIVLVSSMQPQAQRLGTQDMGVETRTVSDLMLQGQTDRAQIDYYEETTLTNAADTVAGAQARVGARLDAPHGDRSQGCHVDSGIQGIARRHPDGRIHHPWAAGLYGAACGRGAGAERKRRGAEHPRHHGPWHPDAGQGRAADA